MRYLFVHLQKTGGTALLQRLREHFGPDAVYPRPEHQGTPATSLDVDLLLARIAAGDDFQVITGHFPLCVAELIDGPVTAFTVLREPVQRTLSLLRHRREVEPGYADADLEAIYERPVVQGLSNNHMVKMLSLTTEEMSDGALTDVVVGEDHLRRATANLAATIDLFGIQERFDDFCSAIEGRYGFDLGRPRFANRTQDHPASRALCDRIARDNELDVRLYTHAVRLLDAAAGSASG